ncbi:MAG: class II aldolase/adducin family protein [SAR324 cluster bacterium]|jgi:ribulose-5-phosphate 4-epimerase/fuculose-1-phosphate aldolase|nr:class II aldolase/adducin family protein [SAR324 cluster bacterium]
MGTTLLNKPTKIRSETPSNFSQQELSIRIELAAAYRLVDFFGWCELIYGHLTAHVPGPEPHFLINPYGLNYDEVTATNLIKIDINGKMVEPSPYAVNEAGFVIHSAVHMMSKENNRVVMHTHSRAGMAIAALEEGLLPISMGATAFFEDIAYHDYEGPSLYLDERERLQESLGDKRVLILRNHGLLTVGRTVAEAFIRLYRLESACQVQLDAGAAGSLRVLDQDLARKSGKDVKRFMEQEDNFGQLEFDALVRKINRNDDSYRL